MKKILMLIMTLGVIISAFSQPSAVRRLTEEELRQALPNVSLFTLKDGKVETFKAEGHTFHFKEPRQRRIQKKYRNSNQLFIIENADLNNKSKQKVVSIYQYHKSGFSRPTFRIFIIDHSSISHYDHIIG